MSSVVNDIDNSSGVPGYTLAESQGYGWASTTPVNMGKAWTQTANGNNDGGEVAMGCPKGLVCGIGAFSTIPASVITPSAAVLASKVVTLTVPAASFVAGDTVRVYVNNVEDSSGNVIAADSTASCTATA